ncbi:MAG: methyltransferase domain-containing protein [Candidatus Poribacteria bacterium]|nr:methyltransferase domain-containing protein [Candidatus Poribacteria bacterium]
MAKDHTKNLPASNSDATYTLGRTSHETTRLIEQSRIYGESTQRLCKRAGIREGMRVLEIGSGAGDVALMLAELVGQEGRVVGVDVNPVILETARQRATEAGIRNVEFIAGDARTLAFADKFDAIVGRFVLMYMADPGEAFAKLITYLNPGGIVAFQEPEYTLYPALLHPDTPLMNQLIEWILDVFEHSGAHLDMGIGLYRAFVDVGLPPPTMHLESPIGAAETWAGYRYMATIFQSLLPLLGKYGLATAEQVDVGTLAARLRQEVLTSKRPFFLPLHITAHAVRSTSIK